MPEPTFPQLRSLSLSAQGRPLSLRVLLPPNFATIASRGGKVPLKVEACIGTAENNRAAGNNTQDRADAANRSVPHTQDSANSLRSGDARNQTTTTEIFPPERLPQGPWSVEPGVFLAGLLIESWCSGRIPSMLQLDTAQLRQLLQPLENTASVFWLKAPQQPIRWVGGELEGVHEHLRDNGAATGNSTAASQRGADSLQSSAPSTASAVQSPFAASDPQSALPQMESDLTPLEVDGSVNFLSLRLPSRESALYPHALALVKDNGFQLEPSNGKWWLRDRHKTLQFLAEYTQDLRTLYKARFTENFVERTAALRFARLEVNIRSSVPRGGDAFELELALSAPGLDEASLQQALEKGLSYIEAAPTHSSQRQAQQPRHAQNTSRHAQNAPYPTTAAAPSAGAAASAQTQSAFVLVPRHVRLQAEQTQQALGADMTRGLRSHFHSRIRREEVAITQTILQSLGGALAAEAQGAEPLAPTSLPAGNAHAPQRDTDAQSGRHPRNDDSSRKPAQPTRHGETTQKAQSARIQKNVRPTGGFAAEMDEPVSLAAKLPAQWLELGRALNNLSALSPCPMPHPLEQSLRPYQRIGAAWLWHLYRSGLGGILADEMGLGKTVQFLAFIATASNAYHANTQSTAALATGAARLPSLVVCPASLVDNWRREAVKFTPHLNVFCHHGDSRLADPAEASRYDLVITSYGTLARDQQLFESIDFLVAAGDEAQHIKNAKTQNARAMRGLRASGRFLMTGTPVENDIKELQSLFTFILPGYLVPAAGTKRTAGSAVQDTASTKEGERAWLVSRAAPYILRRMKRTVASDLPEKIEQVLYCEMGAQQRAFYRQTQEAARRAVTELELGGAADNRVRMAAFTELLRLRQVCIDPRLLDAAEQTASAKRETLLELVQEAAEGGHRMLIFSQFTSALKLVAEDLDELGLRHFYLDGQTQNRAALCERFNADESVHAFLISLRAGGTGLNLTGADTVIHLDPWWNPAAQAQASDRAHRIGQQKVVTVYQLIAAQTVEEQVLTLQRQKTALLEQLLDASDAASAHIGLDDLKALIG